MEKVSLYRKLFAIYFLFTSVNYLCKACILKHLFEWTLTLYCLLLRKLTLFDYTIDYAVLVVCRCRC